MGTVVLAGGVGGARLCHGLFRLFQSDLASLTIVVNTADDFRLHGLDLCPDLDTVLYTLAEVADPERGWGLARESWQVADQLRLLGGETWFQLGDRDLATHLVRTQWLQEGLTLSQVTQRLAQKLGLPEGLLYPMSDAPVRTQLLLQEGWVDFQDYFVRRGQRDAVRQIRYQGQAEAELAPGGQQALERASRIVLAPSNPLLSLLPILGLRGLGNFWRGLKARKVGISPLIGSRAIKGPLSQLLHQLGHPVSSLGVAQLLQPWLEVLVIDSSDAELVEPIRSLGIQVELADILMRDFRQREGLARVALSV